MKTPSVPPSGHSRRDFIRTAALACAAAPFLNSCGTARPQAIAVNEKLHHACIGVGGMMGGVDLRNFLQHPRVQVAALCDVDADALAAAAKLAPGARLYADWRELLEQEADRIDSVNVTVPDHMHFAIAYSAINKGKHVYCQKPMCHDIAEVRALTELSVRRGVITQLGTQAASGIGDRTAVAWLKAGRIGKIQRVVLCANRPGAEQYRLEGPQPAGSSTPPPHLNWDLWLGTAPTRPFAPDIYHPVKWRAWQDFGTGWSGDIGCHVFDATWKGLGLRPPLSVTAKVQQSWQNSPARRGDTWPQSNHIIWTFPGNALTAGETLPVEWFDGEFFPPDDIRQLYDKDVAEYPRESAMVIGTEGAMILPNGGRPELLPEDKFASVEPPDLPSRDHYKHFLDACLGGERTESHFAQSGPMTEAILLGTVAVRVPGERLDWDHARMKITNHRGANRYVRRDYRDGWHVAGF